MSTRCCAFAHCTNNATKLSKWRKNFCSLHNCNYGTNSCICEQPFYLYPFPTVKKDTFGRLKWTSIVNRKNGTENWLPKEDSRVCSSHFLDGKPSDENPYPSINLGYTPAKPVTSRKPPLDRTLQTSTPKKRKTVQFDNTDIPVNDADVPMHYCNDNYTQKCTACSDKDTLIDTLKNKIKELEIKDNANSPESSTGNTTRRFLGHTCKLFKISFVTSSDAKMKFYTGIPSITAFNILFSAIEPNIHKIRYWKGCSKLCNPLKHKKKYVSKRYLTGKEEFLLCLMKIRLGLLNEDLADRFGISVSYVSVIFTTWVKLLARLFKCLVYNPTDEAVKTNLPPSFRNKKYQNVKYIIDCTEVFIEKPSNFESAATTWSDYKQHNTAKLLVSITPAGFINFVSKCYGGRASDKYITMHSGFMDVVKPHEKVLADKGFQMKEEFAMVNVELIIPPGKRGAVQMPSSDVNRTKEIANRRIYVEQAIQRIKRFRILRYEVPLTLLPHLNDIITIVTGMCNQYPPLPKY